MSGDGRTPVGVLLMTYGSAATAEEVPAYLASVRGGREADAELVKGVQAPLPGDRLLAAGSDHPGPGPGAAGDA